MMARQIHKKTADRMRLMLAGCLAILTILAVAIASEVFLADSLGAASEIDAICADPAYANSPLCVGSGSGGDATKGPLTENALNILRVLLWFGGAVTVLFIVVGGLQIITSGGEPEKARRGRSTMVFALIGLVVVILSAVIIQLVYNYVN